MVKNAAQTSDHAITSATHVMPVRWVLSDHPDHGGKIATSYCPGKIVPAAQGRRAWMRDVHQDLAHLLDQEHIRVVVCLLNEAELRV